MCNCNHLVIGLGGTGGRIIRSLRKLIYLEFNQPEPELPRDTKLRYLYVDSSDELMGLDDPSWKVLGQSVQLGTTSQLQIKGAGLDGVLGTVKGFPGIAPWIGSVAAWRDILGGIVGDVLGGQKRRLGRFLFACRAQDYRARIRRLVLDMEAAGRQGCAFHVFCGLAGGTGSGSVVDAVSILRDEFRAVKEYPIRLYAYLPERHPKANWDAGNYHANGYAALVELNALRAGRFVPHDIGGKTHRLDGTDGDAVRYDPKNFSDPFTGCYLFSNVNENGIQFDVEQELPNLVADFFFQKTIFAGALKGDAGAKIEKVENVENPSILGSLEVMEGSRLPVRSRHFLTFGIKRVIVPEDEIHEFLAFNFAHHAAEQLLHNHWQEDVGFLDAPRPSDFREFVQQHERLDKWRATDEHLLLSRGILDADANNKAWKPLAEEWRALGATYKQLAKQRAEGDWLDAIEKLYHDRFNDTFRNMGVARFYETKDRARDPMAREVRSRVEEYVLGEVLTGAMSMGEAGKLVTALLEAVQARAAQFARQSRDRPRSGSCQNRVWPRPPHGEGRDRRQSRSGSGSAGQAARWRRGLARPGGAKSGSPSVALVVRRALEAQLAVVPQRLAAS